MGMRTRIPSRLGDAAAPSGSIRFNSDLKIIEWTSDANTVRVFTRTDGGDWAQISLDLPGSGNMAYPAVRYGHHYDFSLQGVLPDGSQVYLDSVSVTPPPDVSTGITKTAPPASTVLPGLPNSYLLGGVAGLIALYLLLEAL